MGAFLDCCCSLTSAASGQQPIPSVKGSEPRKQISCMLMFLFSGGIGGSTYVVYKLGTRTHNPVHREQRKVCYIWFHNVFELHVHTQTAALVVRLHSRQRHHGDGYAAYRCCSIVVVVAVVMVVLMWRVRWARTDRTSASRRTEEGFIFLVL